MFIDTSKITDFDMLGVSLTELQINGVKVWEKGGELPYTPVEAIQAVGKCRIVTDVSMSDNPKITFDMQQNESAVYISNGFTATNSGQFFRSLSNKQYTLFGSFDGNLAGSDATQRQIVEYSYNSGLATLSTSLGQSRLVQNVATTVNKFSIFANRPDSYAFFGGGLYFSVSAINEATLAPLFDYVPCIYQEQVGFWDKRTESFVGNEAGLTGSLIVPTVYSQSLMQLSIQPDGTPEQQQVQLLAIGAE